MARDAAAADLGVEARHRAAPALIARYKGRDRSLRNALRAALSRCEAFSLDDDADREDVLEVVLSALRNSADAEMLREILGADPADRATRLHAHGMLLEHGAQAAWRLAGGGTVEETDDGEG